MSTSFDISKTRFRTKKLARRIAVFIGRIIRLWPQTHTPCIRVITYHRFGYSALDPVCVAPENFREQLAWLRTNATILTPRHFELIMSGQCVAPKNAVLITIDDGHKSIFDHALPALDEQHISAVLFVCPGLIEAVAARDRIVPATLANWDDLKQAHAMGHEIAPHGMSHRSLGRMPFSNAIDEIRTAKTLLNTRLGVRTPFFSFPFGTLADYSTSLASALEAEGFRFNFTSTHGRCLPGTPTTLLPRLKIENGEDKNLFIHIVKGYMDHWCIVDRLLFPFQQRGMM